MAKVLLVNDDGPNSEAFVAFWRELLKERLGELYVVTPEHEMSAAGKGITLHKPLRMYKRHIDLNGEMREIHLTSGTPADCVGLAISLVVGQKPDLVISGINMGDNTTVDNLFTSGTIAGALQGVLNGAKAVSFSAAIPVRQVEHDVDHFIPHSKIAASISSWMMKNELPGVHLLNVNFPYRVAKKTKIRMTRLGWTKYKNYVMERLDPRGRPYYWIASATKDLSREGRDTDGYALEVEKAISISPIQLNSSIFQILERAPDKLKEDAELVQEQIQGLITSLESLRDEVAP